MNPTYFASRTVAETLSTLVHEMVHLWQAYNGKPGRGRYHNKQWATKMKTIGLQPYNIDEPAKETGDRVTHHIIENGAFDVATKKLLGRGFTITWLDRSAEIATSVDAFTNQEQSNNEVEQNLKVIGVDNLGNSAISKSSSGIRVKYSCPNGHYSVWGKANIDPKCGTCGEFMITEEKKFQR